MGLFRIQHNDFEEKFNVDNFDTMHPNEWENSSRIDEIAWVKRYEYEAALIDMVVQEHPTIKTVLELGSGPGILSQNILKLQPSLEYHLVDKPFAKKYFDEHNFKGKFFVKDLSDEFDTDGLTEKYDLVIMNDFLEHVFNPSVILRTLHKLTSTDSIIFISNPNWRMAHQYVYRGLFDFDNFIYMLFIHNFELLGLYSSNLKTPDYPRISSESMLPEEYLRDWNHYMVFKQR